MKKLIFRFNNKGSLSNSISKEVEDVTPDEEDDEVEASYDEYDVEEEEDIDEGFDEPEFGIILGGSYPLPVMDGKLNLNAGYYLGLIEHDDALTFNSIFAHLSYSL